MKRVVWAFILLISVLFLAACSAQGAAKPTSSEGLEVAFGTSPSPAQMGQVALFVDVRDAEGKPVDNAMVTMKADMTGHSMGDLSGQATAQGNGRYTIRANLSMAGNWVVQVQVQTRDISVKREFKIDVQ